MRPDGDPERDDYGLPHVDVVVPDDARELDRDLIAWRREERQRRRREQLRRLLRPITRFGPAVPIITAALLIAIVSGALITILGPTPNNSSRQSAAPSSSSAKASTQAVRRPGELGGPLPQGTITLDGKSTPITDLQGAVIMLVPAGCRCAQAVQSLAQQARQNDVNAVAVAGYPWTATTGSDLARLTAGKAHLGHDETGILSKTYQASGLTALLVHIDGIVTDITTNIPDTGIQLPAAEVKGLTGPGAVLAPNTTPGH